MLGYAVDVLWVCCACILFVLLLCQRLVLHCWNALVLVLPDTWHKHGMENQKERKNTELTIGESAIKTFKHTIVTDLAPCAEKGE